jgi:hypothetical protein
MKTLVGKACVRVIGGGLFCLIFAAHGADVVGQTKPSGAALLQFGAEYRLGQSAKNPSTPFLRFAPDGRLFAVWTEDDDRSAPAVKQEAAAHDHESKMKRAPSPMRAAMLASSNDGGKTWSHATRINSGVEAIEGEEGGPRIAFGDRNQAYIVWSVPNEKGDKTRANIRFAMADGKGGFTPARTLNEVKDTARFPIIEAAPDDSLLVAWIDRRVDNPTPRSLYLMRLSATGGQVTSSYKIGAGLCECCRLGFAFADGGRTIYMVDRQVSNEQVRNHALRKSTDGGKTFDEPVEVSDDGWQVPSCPHSGPTVGRDARGYLHVTWFTLGRSEKEAGIYYAVSKDGGRTFAPRELVHANTAPEILHTTLAVAADGTVYFAWDNLDGQSKAQVFVRSLAPDGHTWSPVQQISRSAGNATRPMIALSKKQLHVAWTETEGERSWIVLKSATLGK